MTDALFWAVVAVLGTSFLVCAVLVLTQRWHGRLSLDSDLEGVQKMHTIPVPRIGGLGIVVGLLIGIVVGYHLNGETYPTVILLLAAATPVFVAGIVEDLTKRVSVRTRLIASFVSGALGVYLADAQLTRLDTPLLDDLMVYGPIAFAFTCFAVGGMTHAVNIIDGLNGLASGTVVIILAGLAAMAWQTNDLLVMRLCLWGMAGMVGFMVFNFPFGRIFLGDGGAYLAGFWVATCAVLLLSRNPEVSTWAVLLSLLYPVWETVYSMYRRKVLNRARTGMPDTGHLHHLVFRAIETRHPTPPGVRRWLSHSITSTLLWSLVALCQTLAVVWMQDTMRALIATVCTFFLLAYIHGLLRSGHALHDTRALVT
jgi:UDP-N-acetylmuramyl pentapeptide phosphotransferase/UDP-N-acetylglucosamine-1-phosphate transferase